MEQEISQVNDQTPTDNVDVEAETTQESDSVAYSTYRKVVGKSKKVMSENEELRNQLQGIEQNKMQADGRKDELIKALRDELNGVKEVSQKDKQSYAWNIFSENIKTEAAKRGCLNPSKLIKLLDKEDLGSVEVDDNYRVNGDDLTRLMDKAMKENEFLFQRDAVKVNDITPNSSRPETGKGLDQMTTAEKLVELAKLDM